MCILPVHLDMQGLRHGLSLDSAYHGEMPHTNYTVGFSGTIDYLFYSADSLAATMLLGPVDQVCARCWVFRVRWCLCPCGCVCVSVRV